MSQIMMMEKTKIMKMMTVKKRNFITAMKMKEMITTMKITPMMGKMKMADSEASCINEMISMQ